MFQFPGSRWVFRDRRSFGSSPGHFAAFHAQFLMTPRHPPRALGGLTTPTRRRPAAIRQVSLAIPSHPCRRIRPWPPSPSVPSRPASRDAGPLSTSNDPLPESCATDPEGPRSVKMIVPLPLACTCTSLLVADTALSKSNVERRDRATVPAPGRPRHRSTPALAAGQGPGSSPVKGDGHGPCPAAPTHKRGRGRPAETESVDRSSALFLRLRTLVGSRRGRLAGRAGRCGVVTLGTFATGSSILRKEVIQPQVPLRLPCYDLVPITGFIFGACL